VPVDHKTIQQFADELALAAELIYEIQRPDGEVVFKVFRLPL